MSTHITRRNILRGMAVASAATGGIMGATAAPVHIQTPIILTPRQRLEAAIEELKLASNALRPDINDWKVEFNEGDHFMPVMILAIVREK